MPEACRQCSKTDNENHLLNECENRTNVIADYCDFQNIYSNDDIVITEVIMNLESICEFRYANVKMKREFYNPMSICYPLPSNVD